MGADWPALLSDYEAALAQFQRVTEALTRALVDLDSTPEDFRGLFAAEERARDTVLLTRTRLVNAWREAQPDFELSIQAGDTPPKHV
jgi:hypothetical protein